MMDYKQTAINSTKELINALEAQKIFFTFIRDVAPRGAYKMIEKDIEKSSCRIEDQISRAKNIKKVLEED